MSAEDSLRDDASIQPGRATALLCLLGLALANDALGPLARSTSRLAAATCLSLALLAVLATSKVAAFARPPRRIFLLLLVPAAFLCVTRAPLEEGASLAAALCVIVTAAIAQVGLPSCTRLESAAAAGLLLAGWTLLMQRSDAAWRWAEEATRQVTEALGAVSGAGTSLGPSVAGLPLVLLMAAYAAASARRLPRRHVPALLAGLAWIVVLTLLLWCAGVPLWLRLFNATVASLELISADMSVAGYPASVEAFFPAFLFALLLVPSMALPAAGGSPASTGRPRRGSIALAAAAFVAGTCAGLPVLRPVDPAGKPAIALLDRGMVGWDSPMTGRTGLENAGMFGLLPRYLRAAGFEVALSSDALSPASLGRSRVAVVINPTESLQPGEKEALESFVRAGGGLLVLGDHTDISGSMKPLNELLEPYGVSFRFDSAFTPGHWHNNTGFRLPLLTGDLDDANNRLQQSTGASLQLRRPAAPVATARWGFSDAGDRANKDNAFLGDYIHQAAEPFGDLPVVALAYHGEGRVIVFGDTSPFQNISLPFSWPFIARLFLLAGGRQVPFLMGLASLGVILGVLLILVVLARGRLGAMAAVAAGLLAGCLTSGVATLQASPRPIPDDPAIALVDAAHLNDVSMGLWDDESLSGLNVNLSRNGYLALAQRADSAAWLSPAKLLVSISPRRPYTSRELEALRAWIGRGGHFVLSLGWDEKEPASPLLELADLDVAAMPLGPVPVLRKISDDEIFQRLQLEPHFARAWPVTGAGAGAGDVLYAEGQFPIVVSRRMDAGRFTLIADPLFLLNKTLEEEGAAWQGNIAFLRTLFQPSARGAATGSAP
jgi:hypothetical protein